MMEKDIGKIAKNPDTDVIIRIDDFGGKVGLTIREFVKGERYTGFTKAGTRISAEKFNEFKDIINSIQEKDFEVPAGSTPAGANLASKSVAVKKPVSKPAKEVKKEEPEEEEDFDDEDQAM
jgi:hypothetical protein